MANGLKIPTYGKPPAGQPQQAVAQPPANVFAQPGRVGANVTPGTSPGLLPGGSDPTGRTFSVNPAGIQTEYTPVYDSYGIAGWKQGDQVDLPQQDMERALAFLRGGLGIVGGSDPGAMIPGPQRDPRVAGPEVKAKAPGQSEAFAAAKDASSRLTKKAIEAIKDNMTARGTAGSGREDDLIAGVLSDAAMYQSGAELAQQMAAEQQAWEAAKMAFEGDIAQRGQDYGVDMGGYQGQIAQRGQNIDASRQLLSFLPSFLSSIRRY